MIEASATRSPLTPSTQPRIDDRIDLAPDVASADRV
jgi:hypothetical protein